MVGRYFTYRVMPLSVAELIRTGFDGQVLRDPQPLQESAFENLLQFGGFPEPYKQADERFWNLWNQSRLTQLFREDLHDLTRIYDLNKLETLSRLLLSQVGGLLSYDSLAKKIRVANETVRSWVAVLSASYYCFTVSPWSKNVARSLLKQPKLYLYDWSLVIWVLATRILLLYIC